MKFRILLGIACVAAFIPAFRTMADPPVYHVYAGNTHSHTSYTASHGEQYVSDPSKKMIRVGDTQYGTNRTLKPDWEKHQGPPAAHFALAKDNGYDFYVVTDHSQEAGFQPPSRTNAIWLATKRAAAEATDDNFVALAGYEHSENNGPGGTGHINVINSAEYLNALSPGIDLPYLYKWLATVPSDGEGPVVASFNHPGPRQYDDWAYRDPKVTDIITMLEVINSNKSIHYQGFVNALDKGWKVSPVCGNDNHGFWGITHHTSRTFVLATNKTKVAILDAMKNRRTYASLARNLECRYSVNDAIMGSTLDQPNEFRFDIEVSTAADHRDRDKITRLDIVKDGGKVVKTFEPTPSWTVHWTPAISDSTNKYFFVRVWNAGGGDAAGADAKKPVAWLAPVWTGR